MNRDLAANQDANEDTLQILSDIQSELALKKSAAKQPVVAGQIGCVPPNTPFLLFNIFLLRGRLGGGSLKRSLPKSCPGGELKRTEWVWRPHFCD